MITQDKEKYSEELNHSISYLENLEYSNIKADIEDYETSKSYLKKGSKNEMTGAIVAEKEERIPALNLNFKSEKLRLLKSK